MTTTTEARTERCDVGHLAYVVRAWVPPADPARLLLPFTLRAEQLPAQAEQVMREGLSFLAEFGGGPVEDEAALVRSARRFLDRNYPVGVAA